MSLSSSRLLQRLVLACLLLILPTAAAPQALPALNIDIRETSISGLSSGAFAAVQFQVAYSSIVQGAGLVAGGPYLCSRGDALRATTLCSCTLDPEHRLCNVSATSTNVPELVEQTRQLAAQGQVDDPASVAGQRVMIVTGAQDRTVPTPVAEQLSDYYSRIGVAVQDLVTVHLSRAAHTMPTLAYGKDCEVSESPYLGRCGFDVAKAILSWIYGPLKKPAQEGGGGRLAPFDQTPFLPAHRFAWASGMDRSGWAFIPTACARGEKCRVHVVLHGCRQGQSYLPLNPLPDGGLYYGTIFVRHAGYDRWAASNHIVVLYPQAVSIPELNPNGCWDWWGYTDERFATRQGVQLSAIRAMVGQLASGRH